MATKNLSIRYRPVRIGFVVPAGSIEDLVVAAGLNTMLYGGIYNPILPVSSDHSFAESLKSLFNVDVLQATTQNEEIDEFLKANAWLRSPYFFSDPDLYYQDWETKKNVFKYLDSIN